MVPSLPLLSCESSVSVKENPDRKKKKLELPLIISSTFRIATKARLCWSPLKALMLLLCSKIFLSDSSLTFLVKFHLIWSNDTLSIPLWNNKSQLEHLATHFLAIWTKVMLLIPCVNLNLTIFHSLLLFILQMVLIFLLYIYMCIYTYLCNIYIYICIYNIYIYIYISS